MLQAKGGKHAYRENKKRTQVADETEKTMQVSSLGNGVYAAGPFKRKIIALHDLTPINHTNYSYPSKLQFNPSYNDSFSLFYAGLNQIIIIITTPANF